MTVLYCTALYCIACLYCSTMYCSRVKLETQPGGKVCMTVMYCTVLYCMTVYYSRVQGQGLYDLTNDLGEIGGDHWYCTLLCYVATCIVLYSLL